MEWHPHALPHSRQRKKRAEITKKYPNPDEYTVGMIEQLEAKYDEQFQIVFEAVKQLLKKDGKPEKRIGSEKVSTCILSMHSSVNGQHASYTESRA